MNRKNMAIRLLNENKNVGRLYSLTIMITVIFIFNLMNVFHLEGSGIEGVGFTIAIMILQTIMISIINYGYGYRSDINDLFLKREALTYIKEERRGKKLKGWMYVYFLLLVSPFMMIFIENNLENKWDSIFWLFAILSSYALFNIINKFIPLYIDQKKEKCLNEKIDLIVLSNVKFKLFNSKNILYIIIFITLNFIF